MPPWPHAAMTLCRSAPLPSVHRRQLRLERQLDPRVPGGVHEHRIARFELPFEEAHRERVDDLLLQGAFERAGAERRVVAFVREDVFGVVADVDRQTAVAHELREAPQLYLDD